MRSSGIKRVAFGILAISLLGFFFGGSIPIPLTGKFFLGAFGFGTGFVLIIVSNVLRIKEHEPQEEKLEGAESQDEYREDE